MGVERLRRIIEEKVVMLLRRNMIRSARAGSLWLDVTPSVGKTWAARA
jgi:hypothetical protein